jgi:Na+-transporting NADH:ubiquinone oxidoreductase subunit NqrE
MTIPKFPIRAIRYLTALIGIKTIFIALLSVTVPYFTNLYCLAQYDKPFIRGNHVGLSFLSFIVYWGVIIAIKQTLRKKINSDTK